MKRWWTYAIIVCLLGMGIYAGYKTLENIVIQKELQADIQAERDFVSSVEEARLSTPVKQAIANMADEHISQLETLASSSKTYKQFRQQKELLLQEWAQEDELGIILAKESIIK